MYARSCANLYGNLSAIIAMQFEVRKPAPVAHIGSPLDPLLPAKSRTQTCNALKGRRGKPGDVMAKGLK
jgi:hypothetical protein